MTFSPNEIDTSPRKEVMRVGIIGAGAAGLAAGYELTRNGHEVVVYERSPFLGGQASTFEVVRNAQHLERGYHHLFRSDVDMIKLIDELNLSDKLLWLPSKVGVFHKNKVWNFSGPIDLLRFSSIGLVDRLRLGLTAMLLKRERDWRSFESFTAHKWLKEHVGKKAYSAIWEPLLKGKFGQDFKNVGMTWFWGKIFLRFASRGRLMTSERLGYPGSNFSEVFDSIGSFITKSGGIVETETAVRSINIEGGKVIGLEVQSQDTAPRIEYFDSVLSTTPSSIFSKLVPNFPAAYQKKLTSIKYLAAVLVILVLEKPLTDIYWMNIADPDMPFVALIEHTNLISPKIYGDRHILYISNYLSQDNPMYSMSKEELLDQYVPHLSRINPNFDKTWIVDSFYHRENSAQPIIGPNYGKAIPTHRTPVRSLYLANTTQIYPEDRGTNYSVRIGRKVAQMIMIDNELPVVSTLPTPAITDSMTLREE